LPPRGSPDFDERVLLTRPSCVRAEKNGLQVYRNYAKAFERDRAKKFSAEVNSESHDVSRLNTVCDAIASDDERLIPVIACAFADEALDEMYKREVAKGSREAEIASFLGTGHSQLCQREYKLPTPLAG